MVQWRTADLVQLESLAGYDCRQVFASDEHEAEPRLIDEGAQEEEEALTALAIDEFHGYAVEVINGNDHVQRLELGR